MVCIYCPDFTMPLAQVHKSHCKRHAESWAHLDASCGRHAKPSLKRAPTKEQFKDVIAATLAGNSARAPVKNVGQRHKTLHMRACVAEAIRNEHRNFIRNLESPGNICIQRDDSKAKTSIHFKATAHNLDTAQGMLDWSRCDIGDSISKVKSLEKAFKRFSTPRVGFRMHGVVDNKVYEKLRSHTEFMSTDAASPELMAVRIQRNGLELDNHAVLTPKLMYHVRDKAHSTKRVLSRPFDADPFLKNIVKDYILGQDTFFGLIYYSIEFTNHFKRNCELRGVTYKALGLAKHRFSCYQKVLSMLTEKRQCFRETAIYIVTTRGRRTTEYAVARDFLNTSNETTIQIAMMADATDEVPSLRQCRIIQGTFV